MRFLVPILLSAGLLMPGCAALADVNWTAVGTQVAKLTLSAVVAHNSDVAEMMEKNNVSMSDVNTAIDASSAMIRGDRDEAFDTFRSGLERRRDEKRDEDPDGRTPWETYALMLMYAADRTQQTVRGRRRNGTAPKAK